ncbi:hypothetical protein C823_007131 [Eubacterium plexicaudatum ASF492]|uniref:Uncharacterized protein n=1 Tax=Eubacterium plexicaudatum ASF492 TaxID=1235802 RepID=N2ACF6_9FIRM|nr:hypothetical protein C823_007131 [Eubacterium plexicaudatum ASF492]
MRGLYGTGVKGIACKKEKEHKKESIRKREKKRTKTVVIQKILFPQIGRCTEQQMYFRAAAEKTERKKRKEKIIACPKVISRIITANINCG